MSWTERTRRLAQLGFAGFVVYTSLVHNLSTVDGATASIDPLCPFGAVETFWHVVSSGGRYYAATPPVTAVPDAAGTPAPHTGVGAGAGTGSTPLPAGQILRGDQVKGRMSLREVSQQCGVSLPALQAAVTALRAQ